MSQPSTYPLAAEERICLPCDGLGENRKGIPCPHCYGDGTVIV